MADDGAGGLGPGVRTGGFLGLELYPGIRGLYPGMDAHLLHFFAAGAGDSSTNLRAFSIRISPVISPSEVREMYS